MANLQVSPANNGAAIPFNAKYAEGIVTAEIGNLINTQNDLLMREGETMASLGILSMNAAVRQSNFTSAMGYLEGSMSVVQAGVNLSSAGLNMANASELAKDRKIFEDGYKDAQGKDINGYNQEEKKINDIDGQFAADAQVKVVDGNVPLEQRPQARDPLSVEKKQEMTRDKEAALRNQQKLRSDYDNKTQVLRAKLDKNDKILQSVNALGNGTSAVARTQSQSQQNILGAQVQVANQTLAGVKDAQDGIKQAVQGETNINAYGFFERM